jgi:hypothetical protein
MTMTADRFREILETQNPTLGIGAQSDRSRVGGLA